MPFTGKWAYDVNVDPPYVDSCPAGQSTCAGLSSHPSVHHTPGGGDWATDLYAGSGTDVKLLVTSPDGPVTFSFNRSNDTCSSAGPNVAGHGITLNVFVGGVAVGWVEYEHLDNIPAAPYTNGMTIGKITSEPFAQSPTFCYTARHAHIELRNVTAGAFSCWTDHGHPGTTVNQGDDIGTLGAPNTGRQQACGTAPADPPDSDGDGVTDAADRCPITAGKFRSSGCPLNMLGSADFNADHHSDLALYSGGKWYVSSGANPDAPLIAGLPMATAGDVPMVADYNGDGTTDFITYSGNRWFVKSGKDPNPDLVAGVTMGTAGDVPMVADYNGDGTTDFIIYSGNRWFVKSGKDPNPDLVAGVTMGTAGDVPMVADYNGDGTTDFITYSGNRWFVKSGKDPNPDLVAGLVLGNPGDVPLLGDFDADGVPDFAVSNGFWAARSGVGPNNVKLFEGVHLGGAGDEFVTGLPAPRLYHPLQPTRILDTRPEEPQVPDDVSGAVGPGETLPFKVLGKGGIPDSGVGAVVLNVTVTQPTSFGYLQVFPTGHKPPGTGTSNVNFAPGQSIPNLVIAPVGDDGSVSVFNSHGNSHVIYDVMGWLPA
ncbi:MAG TPA: VCBS repeat-containing protein [Acidimicrobiales bacterium]|nr:VCBS repeat-containing protein [Acidimicrobiales bacterium]